MFTILLREESGPVDRKILATIKFLAEKIDMELTGVWANGSYQVTGESGRYFFPANRIKHIKDEDYNER